MPMIKLQEIQALTKSINPEIVDAAASEKEEIETQRKSSRLREYKGKTNEHDIDAIMAHSALVSQEDIETNIGNPETQSAQKNFVSLNGDLSAATAPQQTP